jgi:hypothetical protein
VLLKVVGLSECKVLVLHFPKIPFYQELAKSRQKEQRGATCEAYAAFELFRLAFDRVFMLAVLSARKASIPTVSLANCS